MKELEEVNEIANRLLGPGGCPWDQVQTFESLRHTLLEEVCEVIEAVNFGDHDHLREELGDLLFNVFFYCKLAEKTNLFSLKEVLAGLRDKLIRRHPHVFGEAKVEGLEGLRAQWERIKLEENKDRPKQTPFDSVSRALPGLARAQKILSKLDKLKLPPPSIEVNTTELAIGERLWKLVQEAHEQDIDAEQALLKVIAQRQSQLSEKSVLPGTS